MLRAGSLIGKGMEDAVGRVDERLVERLGVLQFLPELVLVIKLESRGEEQEPVFSEICRRQAISLDEPGIDPLGDRRGSGLVEHGP